MNLTDRDLQDLVQEATTRARRPDAECLDADLLARMRLDDLDDATRASAIEHLAECSDCAGEYRALDGLDRALDYSPRPVVPFPAPVTAREARWRSFAAAAMLALVAAIGFTIWRVDGPVAPGDGRDRGTHTVTLRTMPAHQTVVAEPPSRLVWEPIPDATAYQVRMYDSESTPIWQSEFTITSQIAVPDEIRGLMRRGTPVYWRVIAVTPAEHRASSLLQFTVAVEPAR